MTNKRYAIAMTAGMIAGCALMGTLAFTPLTLTEDATSTPQATPTPELIEHIEAVLDLPDCAVGEEAIPTDTGYICGPADLPVPDISTPEVLPPPAEEAPIIEDTTPVSWEKSIATPCAQEDSQNCYWLAAERGNGQGDSFIDLGGVTYYFGQAN